MLAPPSRAQARAIFAAAALALLLLVPTAHSQATTVVWASATHPDRFTFTATVGKRLTFSLGASASSPAASVLIEPVGGLPAGASISTSGHGNAARATFSWRPVAPGDYSIGFVAKAGAGAAAPVRTYLIRVNPTYPHAYRLTDHLLGHWAPVLRRVIVRSQPKLSARAVTRLGLTTSDGTQNLVLVLDGLDENARETWYRVRLPILPNNSTGWVPRRALGDLYAVNTHLYVDRATQTATLKRNGVTVFTTQVGVGKPYWPTPRGEFYVRDKLTNFGDPFYGPVAFGTSARSAVLTDWPGGGFVGIHGTSLPELLPGHVSHGCIRLKNDAILKLARLMKVGTPVTIR
jgi:L,D-transpeptidase catalytic domain